MSRYDNEWGLPKLPGVISMTKVKNALKKHHPEVTAKLSNIRINGQLRGCSGFLTDSGTGKIVYINTEAASRGEAYYRTAEHDRDYRGGLNHFCDPSEVAEEAVALLKKE